MPPVAGVGSLIVNDILTSISYQLIEPCVNAVFPTFINGGIHVVDVWDPSMYVGAMILVGDPEGDLEVVTITATDPGTSFTATFENDHTNGEAIIGATFPVQNTAGDPFWTQDEMLTNLSTALNDFLVRVPLLYQVDDSLSFTATQQVLPLPSDCMMPVRISAFGSGLRETSQSNLDAYDYRWSQASAAEPYCYYRDKVGLNNFGIYPKANNVTPVEIIYQQRAAQTFGLTDGLPIPDPFLVYIKARMLEICYSKDGEQRSPAAAKFFNGRYENGIRISSMFLEAIQDPNLQ